MYLDQGSAQSSFLVSLLSSSCGFYFGQVPITQVLCFVTVVPFHFILSSHQFISLLLTLVLYSLLNAPFIYHTPILFSFHS